MEQKQTCLDQSTKHSQRSEKYNHVQTSTIVNSLIERGYKVRKYQESRTNVEHRKGFQKHLIRLSIQQAREINQTVPELVIINSHDGTTAFRILVGLYRLVCANGLILGSTVDEHRITHVEENIIEKIQYACNAASMQADKLVEIAANWDKVKLSAIELIELGQQALDVRIDRDKQTLNKDQKIFNIQSILQRRRQADKEPTLWQTFNAVQENCLNPLIVYNREEKLVTARAPKAIDTIVTINKKLYDIFETKAA